MKITTHLLCPRDFFANCTFCGTFYIPLHCEIWFVIFVVAMGYVFARITITKKHEPVLNEPNKQWGMQIDCITQYFNYGKHGEPKIFCCVFCKNYALFWQNDDNLWMPFDKEKVSKRPFYLLGICHGEVIYNRKCQLVRKGQSDSVIRTYCQCIELGTQKLKANCPAMKLNNKILTKLHLSRQLLAVVLASGAAYSPSVYLTSQWSFSARRSTPRTATSAGTREESLILVWIERSSRKDNFHHQVLIILSIIYFPPKQCVNFTKFMPGSCVLSI